MREFLDRLYTAAFVLLVAAILSAIVIGAQWLIWHFAWVVDVFDIGVCIILVGFLLIVIKWLFIDPWRR